MRLLGLIGAFILVAAAAAWAQQKTVVGCVGGSASDLLLTEQSGQRVHHLQGNTAEARNNLGKMVKLTGRQISASGGNEATIAVESVEKVADNCQPQAPAAQAATGKTGPQGQAENTTSTATQGQVTPGIETEAGQAQAPGSHAKLGQGAAPQHRNTAGAPPVPEQTAQNPADAEKNARAAQRAELDKSQQQLGVNAQPSYAQNRQEETPSQPKKELQAGDQEPSQPTLVGCLSEAGPGNQFVLTEKSGSRYRLNASAQDLKDHINHLVEVVGKPAKREGGAVAANSERVFEVSGIQDLAPTCGARK